MTESATITVFIFQPIKLHKSLRKENIKWETESFHISAPNYAVMTNYVKSRIENRQQKTKCRFCSEWDEMVYHIVSECSRRLWKKYKTSHDRVRKVIYRELDKIFKFYYSIKSYIQKPESVLQNEIHKMLRDCQMQNKHLIHTEKQAEWCLIGHESCCSRRPPSKNFKSEHINKNLDLAI